MNFFTALKLFLSILGVLVLHQFVVLLYSIGVAIGYGIDNADALNEGAISEAMLGDAVLAQATNSLIFAGVVMIGFLWMLSYSKRESFVKTYRFQNKPTRIQLFLAITIGFSAVFFSSFIVQGLALVFPQAYEAYVEAFENLELGSSLSFFLAVVIMAPLLAPRMAFFIDQGFNIDESVSRVTRFALDGNTITLAAAGEFLGTPLNQFSMDEYEGYLRITTTQGFGDDTNNRLLVLDDNLTIVASLDKLGKPRERLQSTRFIGDRAYLVTFELTDPFYVIDLSNPLNPTILGELEITGFSSYLQPLDANHILGIGFEADDQGQQLGLKLAIYNVTDPTNPIEQSKAVLLYEDFGWNFASVTYNHKDLLLDLNKSIIGFPFSSYNYSNNAYTFQTGYMVYSFTDLLLTQEAFIQHSDAVDYMNDMQKGLFLEDYLYTVSRSEVGITRLANLTELIALVNTTK